ncbi:MAG: aminopeptidase [Betaproteobacteria bacterium]|nr:aminopeptidase [Betaproteobacteria bacterium]
MRTLALIVLTVTALAAGCSTLGYYLQSVEGQLTLLQSRQQISAMLADSSTPEPLKKQLERTLAIRDFASSELKLPDNDSYRSYADLQRPYVVWNVFAAREFSIKAEQWCFPIAGCVGYRGYFSKTGADNFARELGDEGYDVYVGGVPAYSTLGYFNDPVLNTFVNYSEYEVARLIFHELGHQVMYVKNDTQFNESFAVAVETVGITRWIDRYGDEKMRANFARSQERRSQFAQLVLKHRHALGELYKSKLAPAEMRKRKARTFGELKEDYRELKREWGGFAGYDRFLDDPNNAKLASVSFYSALVPHFLQLLAKLDGDLPAFYAEAKRLAALSETERYRALGATPPDRDDQ